MKFPEKYILKGQFELHSGQKSNLLYDVNVLLTDEKYRGILMDKIPHFEHYVGVATGGAIIAGMLADKRKVKFSMVKDGELKGELPLGDWLLIDDVITTGNSLEEAIKIIGRNPPKIYVAVDRRGENRNPRVYSIFEKP